MGLTRRAAALALAATALAAGCGGESADPGAERLREADQALALRPADPQALAEVVRAAAAAAGRNVDTGTGGYQPEARPFLERAAAVWPRYLEATGNRPRVDVASLMVAVYGNGLRRPREAARAAAFVAEARPSAASYLSLADWSARAGDTRRARIAGQKALELADPEDRDRVRSAIRRLVPGLG